MKRHSLKLVVATVAALSGAQMSLAEVSRSDKNAPGAQIADQMSALLGHEKNHINALTGQALGVIATGPITAEKAAKSPAAAGELRYEQAFLATQPAPAGDKEWACLAQAIYFEARGESLKGQFAVAEVILNRRDSGLYPASICGVVGQRGGGSCQFSYVCDGISDVMRDKSARTTAGRIARLMLDGAPRQLTDGATHFHTRAVAPGWARKFARTAAIGAHLFYRQPGAKSG